MTDPALDAGALEAAKLCLGDAIAWGCEPSDALGSAIVQYLSALPGHAADEGEAENALEDAAKAAFIQAQSVYRGAHDHFPLKHTWETTFENVREGWRKIAHAAVEAAMMPPLGTQPEPRQSRLSRPAPAPQGEDAELIRWLNEAASYFEGRLTNGEDRAHWSNVANAQNCRVIADRLAALSAEVAAVKAEIGLVLQKGLDRAAEISARAERAEAALAVKDKALDGLIAALADGDYDNPEWGDAEISMAITAARAARQAGGDHGA